MSVLNTIKIQMNSAEYQTMSLVYVVFSWGFYYWNARYFTYNNMLVIAVVIGSGVFFKADDVLKFTDGNFIIALLAWTIGAF